MDGRDAYSSWRSSTQRPLVAAVSRRETHTAVLLITHDLDFARDVADRVLFMNQGRIVVEGEPGYVFDECQEPGLREFLKPR